MRHCKSKSAHIMHLRDCYKQRSAVTWHTYNIQHTTYSRVYSRAVGSKVWRFPERFVFENLTERTIKHTQLSKTIWVGSKSKETCHGMKPHLVSCHGHVESRHKPVVILHLTEHCRRADRIGSYGAMSRRLLSKSVRTCGLRWPLLRCISESKPNSSGGHAMSPCSRPLTQDCEPTTMKKDAKLLTWNILRQVQHAFVDASSPM